MLGDASEAGCYSCVRHYALLLFDESISELLPGLTTGA